MWYSPLMESLAKYMGQVRSAQVTFLVLLPDFYIPSDYNSDAAHYLHRLRRRTVLVILSFFPARCGQSCGRRGDGSTWGMSCALRQLNAMFSDCQSPSQSSHACGIISTTGDSV